MARRPKRRALPLRYRLPNPPAVFFGRGDDVVWLSDAVERGPVSLVAGPGGLGKTSVALATIAQRFPRRTSDTLFVHVGVGDRAATVVARALAEALSLDDLDWSALSQEEDGLVALVVDLAEQGPFWVVLDDLHNAEPEESSRLLLTLSRYARKSRWIVTTRMDPRLTPLAGQVRSLEGLSRQALVSLASEAGADDDTAEHAAAVSAGSPLRLLSCIVGVAGVPPGSGDPMLNGLSEQELSLVRTLAAVTYPLSTELLERLGLAARPAVIGSLERRGLVRTSPSGLTLHDVVRDVARGEGLSADVETVFRIAKALAEARDPASSLASARMIAEQNDTNALAEHLDEVAPVLLRAGRARELWELLAEHAESRLSGHRLRCAVELGAPEVLARLRAPTNPTSTDRLAWARALMARGRLDEAADELTPLLDARGPQIAWDAHRLMALCRMSAERFTDALAVLDAAAPHTPDAAAVAAALRAGCLITLGDSARAREVVDGLVPRLDGLEASARIECALAIAQTRYAMGDLAGALSGVETVLKDVGRSPFAHRRGRWALALRALILLDQGNLSEARADLDKLAPLLGRRTLLRLSAQLAECGRRLAAGEHDGLASLIDDTLTDAIEMETSDHAHMAALFRLQLATSSGEPTPDSTRLSALRSPHPLVAYLFAVRSAATSSDVEEIAGPTHPEADVVRSICSARAAIAVGDAAAGLSSAEAAVRIATASGYRVHLAEARGALLDALLTSDEITSVPAEAARLQELATSMPSTHYSALARLFESLSRDSGLEPAIVETVAAHDDDLGPAVRRARALLGADVALDPIDRSVIEAIIRLRGWRVPERLGATQEEPWAPGWGLDQRRKEVWLSDGRAVDLSGKRLLFGLLSTLAIRGGAATKEHLVLACWDEAEYHPLRHDNRLHAAIRKLRRLVEDDPTTPARIITTDEGYALGGVVRRLA